LQSRRPIPDKFLERPTRNITPLWGRLVLDKSLEPPPRKPPPRKKIPLSCLEWHRLVPVKFLESPLRNQIVLRLVPEKIPEPLTRCELPLQWRRLDLDQFLEPLAGTKTPMLWKGMNSPFGLSRLSEFSTQSQYRSLVRCFRSPSFVAYLQHHNQALPHHTGREVSVYIGKSLHAAGLHCISLGAKKLLCTLNFVSCSARPKIYHD
jgi:hypothetical protein